MRITDQLRDEHRIIERVVAALSTFASRALEDGEVDLDLAERILDFLRGFADHVHHAKEEDLLFPALMRSGLPRDAGPLAVMLGEHVEARRLTASLTEAVDEIRQGQVGAVVGFHDDAMAYAELLRAHIHKEDTVLFPLAERMLDGVEELELDRELDELERSQASEGEHERCLLLALDICQELDVPEPAGQHVRPGGR